MNYEAMRNFIKTADASDAVKALWLQFIDWMEETKCSEADARETVREAFRLCGMKYEYQHHRPGTLTASLASFKTRERTTCITLITE